METMLVAVLALALLLFALISEQLQNSSLTPPMVFTALGIVIGPVLGLLHGDVANELVLQLAEVTLVIILFTDATRIELGLLRRQYGLALRLLGIGLPLTVLLGAIVAALMFRRSGSWNSGLSNSRSGGDPRLVQM